MQALPHKGREFVDRAYTPRAIGMGLGFFCVASVFYQQEVSWLWWLFLIAQAFIWPHFAHVIGTESKNPYRAEWLNLHIDSLISGLWVALMSFNLLPSATILSMIAMQNISAGGKKQVASGLLAQALGLGLGLLMFGFSWAPESTMLNVISCLPLIIIFPLSMELVMYRLSVNLQRRKKELEVISREDPMTGVYNRGYWEQRAIEEFQRCRRGKTVSSMVLVDIDDFKQINDTYGHIAGDDVIKTVSSTIASHLRSNDLLGRLGGDEFALLLTDTDELGAWVFADRMRLLVEKETLALKGFSCTVSIGIAQFDSGLEDYLGWVGKADAALYQAKAAGRNRAEIFSSEAAAAPFATTKEKPGAESDSSPAERRSRRGAAAKKPAAKNKSEPDSDSDAS